MAQYESVGIQLKAVGVSKYVNDLAKAGEVSRKLALQLGESGKSVEFLGASLQGNSKSWSRVIDGMNRFVSSQKLAEESFSGLIEDIERMAVELDNLQRKELSRQARITEQNIRLQRDEMRLKQNQVKEIISANNMVAASEKRLATEVASDAKVKIAQLSHERVARANASREAQLNIQKQIEKVKLQTATEKKATQQIVGDYRTQSKAIDLNIAAVNQQTRNFQNQVRIQEAIIRQEPQISHPGCLE